MKTLIFCIFILLISLITAQIRPVAAPPSLPDEKEPIFKQEPNIWNVFQKRRSVRRFRPDTIPECDVHKIIDAARMSPTSGNQQPWIFLIIRDQNKINQMKEKCIERSLLRYNATDQHKTTQYEYEKLMRTSLANYFSAPVYIVVLTDNHSLYPDYNHWDGPLAAGCLMLAARALGYGTVFITDVIPESVSKEILRIPDRYTRVCITPVGIPVEWPVAPHKNNLEDFIIHEKF